MARGVEVEFGRHEYWTFWAEGQRCSVHKSLAAAKREVYACERRGGSEHTIYQVSAVFNWRNKSFRKAGREK
jgi:hypothetical protein